MIKDLLRTIPEHLRKQLMCAFEQGIQQMVQLEDDYFLGVNIVDETQLDIEEVAGAFSYGRIKK